MFCEQCGAPIPEGAKFCEQCGAPVAGPAPVRAQSPEPVPQPAPQAAPQAESLPRRGEARPRRFSPLRLIIGTLLLVALAYAAHWVLANL